MLTSSSHGNYYGCKRGSLLIEEVRMHGWMDQTSTGLLPRRPLFLLLYLLTTFLLLSLTSATELKVGLLNFCGKEELLLVWTFYKHKNLCNTLKERIMHDVSPLLPAPTFLFEDKRVN